jgi:hypothetical protein
VIGGVIGAMIMSLLVLRVLYLLFNAPVARHEHREHHEETPAEPVLAGSTEQPFSLWRNDE